MTEKLLQYVWNFKIFNNFDFLDIDGNPLEILDFGKWNFDSGPDFSFGKIKTNNIILSGNIEIHVNSSDWIFHQHTGNPEYENIILHVVYNHDCEIEELKNKNIPTLELKEYLNESLLWKYNLLLNDNQFIACEKIFDHEKIPIDFWENALLKKLDEKSTEIEEALLKNKNNYEAVLFHHLAYAFGLKVNAAIFQQLAESIDFKMVNKIRQNSLQLEALFFGICGWLENPQDAEMAIWKREFQFLQNKFQFPNLYLRPKFSKLRPPNFPTIRLSQLAALLHRHQNLFSQLISAKNIQSINAVFDHVKASSYWNQRFNFGKITSIEQEKTLTMEFRNLIILNAILPLKYYYHKNNNENIADEILDLYRSLPFEKNTITEGWKNLGVPPTNALESQALLYHHKQFCQPKRCLNCSIGLQLLKST